MPLGGTSAPNPKSGQLISRQSTVWTRRQNAVCVRNAKKTYGRKSNTQVILDNLNMTVPKGCIYGLLGASGCGKTTLLNCIVGRRLLNSGEIWVLGGHPGSKGSGVPGPRVGYMPQELALYGEFSIAETMFYFGWIAGMKTKDIENRTEFLISLLGLPPKSRIVKNLSGGQQRRVSMAATFLHEPELLILDEPTVGIDPILRQNIWDYLVELTTLKGTTIIITTHYIDETKQASLIGLMRGGRFLAEESPAELLQRYNSDSLEDAFLKLSLVQNKFKRRRSSIILEVVAANTPAIPELQDGEILSINEGMGSEISGEFGDNISTTNVTLPSHQAAVTDPVPPDEKVASSWIDIFKVYNPHHMKALIWKNFLWLLRNISVLTFIIAMPIMQIGIFCLAIGTDPVGLRVAVINREYPGKASCDYNSSCDEESMSCRYLYHLSIGQHNLIPYEDNQSAEYDLKKGLTWATVDIPPHFSQYLWLRFNQGQNANDTTLKGSEIDVTIDLSNQYIGAMLQRDVVRALNDFAADMEFSCNLTSGLLTTPIQFNKPIFGPENPDFRSFAAPGVMLTIVFFLAVALTSGTMLLERNEGMFERCLVSGITGLEILSSHVVTQLLVMMCQSCIILIFTLLIFGITNNGNLWLVILMILLCGTCGMTYGFLVSCVCDSERNATYLAMGSFLPFVMLCGIIWPVEGMHYVLRSISIVLPLTLSTESFRSVLARGWNIEYETVYLGYISIFTWIIIFMIVSILLIKFKKG